MHPPHGYGRGAGGHGSMGDTEREGENWIGRPEGSGSWLWYDHDGRQWGGQWEEAESRAAADGSSCVGGHHARGVRKKRLEIKYLFPRTALRLEVICRISNRAYRQMYRQLIHPIDEVDCKLFNTLHGAWINYKCIHVYHCVAWLIHWVA
jgi:hypothetical protein